MKIGEWSDETKRTFVTRESLELLIEEIKNAPIKVCGITEPHMLNPNFKDGTWVICANCFGPVQVPEGFEARYGRKENG